MRKSTKKTTVSARSLAAFRAHRTRLAQQMTGCTKSVRVALASKLVELDRRLATMNASDLAGFTAAQIHAGLTVKATS